MKALAHCLVLISLFLSAPIFAMDKFVHQPSIVEIRVFDDEKNDRLLLAGMGFAIEEDGFILSSYKTLVDPTTQKLLSNISVFVPEHNKSYTGELVGVEPTIDLSIIKIFPHTKLKDAKILDYEALNEGDALFAKALPLDIKSTKMNAGTLVVLGERECYQENMTSTMLKSSLEENELTVGAPVLDHLGQVVAIYTGYKPQHEEWESPAYKSYLLPAFLATNIYDSLKHKKSMKSPWTGFSVRRLNDSEQQLFPTDRGEQGGIAIEEVWKNSPAEKLGIKKGDVLLRFGHYRIESPADFQKWLYMYGVGHEVKLLILRGGKSYIQLEYAIEERPDWAVPR